MADDTDHACQLVAQLLEKLASLDTKVKLYRQDMAQEFQRHSRELLGDVPRDVASRVEQSVADSLHSYPALNPGFSDLASSKQANQMVDPLERIELDRRARAGSRSPPPKLPHTSGVPREQGGVQRSPHEREREFHGLFTPSYLPLLEAAPPRSNSATNSVIPIITASAPSTLPSSSSSLPRTPCDRVHSEPNNSKDSSAPSPSSLNTVATPRPNPTRRHTEETLSSVTSDDSGSRSRPRSALRRSSSTSTKTQSPRRVRFEVEGTEVLPTMSPMLSPRLSDLPGSPLNSTDNVLGQFEEGSSVRDSLGGTYNDDVPETELLGSSPPRPKKVSSTDRLKALARSSTEDTSKWTVVGDLQGSDDEEDELVMGGRSGSLRGMVAQAANQAQPSLAGMSQSSAGHYINDPRLPTQMGAGLPIVRERDEDADPEEEQDYDSSDSDELAMPARGSKKLQPSSSSTGTASRPIKTAPPAPSTGTAGTSRSSVPASASTPATSTSDGTSHAESQVDEEDMFDFDDEHHDSSKASEKAKTASSKYIDEEEDEAEADSPVTTPSRRAAPPPDLSSSAPRNITATKLPPPPKSPTSAIAAGLMGTSMGSYKGRSIMFGVVKNEQLHEQASRMGNFTSFVGSVDGRTGVDEKGSYRPGSMAFSGTPKSFSERMLREELEEEEAARKDESAVP